MCRRQKLQTALCRATELQWRSIFSENPLVNQLSRLIDIRMVRPVPLDVAGADQGLVGRPEHREPLHPCGPRERARPPLLLDLRTPEVLDEHGEVDLPDADAIASR